jgi:hypothetical protein
VRRDLPARETQGQGGVARGVEAGEVQPPGLHERPEVGMAPPEVDRGERDVGHDVADRWGGPTGTRERLQE